MEEHVKATIVTSLTGYRIPRYRELPDVGLYLEQVSHYVNTVLAPIGVPELTTSMISNYVKQGLVSSPLKKRYSNEQVAYLIFICMAKTVLSIDNLSLFISMQKSTYGVSVAYDYFCDQLELALRYVCGLSDSLEDTGVTESEEKIMLRHATIAMANVAYVNKCFEAVRQAEGAERS